jgi:cytoskeleton protein RodZ
MASFGESLRREREMRGVSLEEISATTKISLRFLQALEADDFAKVPGGLFARSFLRSYASYLGLDTERLLAEYQLVAPRAPEGRGNFMMTRQAQGRRGSVNHLVPWIVAVPLLAAGYTLYRYSHRNPEIPVTVGVTASASNPPAQAARDAANHSPSSSGATTPGSAEAVKPAAQLNTTTASAGQGLIGAEKSVTSGPQSPTETGASSSGTPIAGRENTAGRPPDASSATPTGTTAKGLARQGDLVLEVATTERAWVAVDADGKAIFQRTLNPNELKTFTAKDSFEVWTGNAQGTLLTLNGTRQKSLGRKGEIKRIHLTRNSGQQPAP